ncbi:hypothetical protein [Mesorhizobium sp. IMUNJ 23232]|uniref:hypothetical protein n=1 Tax=Mesorhizobium sp. IMUNJ 23232 TaxID=3376064 RepID=UPI0037A3EF41
MTMLSPQATVTDIDTDGRTITVHVPLTFRKRGGRKLVISAAGQEQSPLTSRLFDRPLLRSVVQAFEWQRLLDQGQYATIGGLAKARKLDRSLVSRTFRLTLLAPEIVEAILDGRQTDGAQRQAMLHSLSTGWNEQARAINGDA